MAERLQLELSSGDQNSLFLVAQGMLNEGVIVIIRVVLLCTLGSMRHDSWASFWLTPLQALALVMSPRLGLRHSPLVEEEINVLIDTYKLFPQCICFHLDPGHRLLTFAIGPCFKLI